PIALEGLQASEGSVVELDFVDGPARGFTAVDPRPDPDALGKDTGGGPLQPWCGLVEHQLALHVELDPPAADVEQDFVPVILPKADRLARDRERVARARGAGELEGGSVRIEGQLPPAVAGIARAFADRDQPPPRSGARSFLRGRRVRTIPEAHAERGEVECAPPVGLGK